MDPCTTPGVGSNDSVTAVVQAHAWAAGVAHASSQSCAALLAILDDSHPAWAELLRMSSYVQLADSGSVTEAPAWTLTTLTTAAQSEVSVARNESLAMALAPACMGASCSTVQALAADAIAGSLRLRDEPGWARVGDVAASAPISFPNDHLLREFPLLVGRALNHAAIRPQLATFPTAFRLISLSTCR